jgi:hypothetical protein
LTVEVGQLALDLEEDAKDVQLLAALDAASGETNGLPQSYGKIVNQMIDFGLSGGTSEAGNRREEG